MNHIPFEVKEKLIDDIWAMVNEMERLTTLEQSKITRDTNELGREKRKFA